DALALIALSLQVHPPLAAEPVELVDVRTAHERRHRLVDAAQVDALLEDLVAVDAGVDLGYRGAPDRVDRSHLRPFPRGCHERLQVLRKERNVTAAAVLDPHGEATRGPETRDGGRREAESERLVDLTGELPVEATDHRIDCVRGSRTFRPLLERDEVEAAVRRRAVAQEREARDGVVRLDF